MSLSLLPAERAQYSRLIDRILSESDLQTISAKQLRKALQSEVGKDISGQKDAVQALILERFDLANQDVALHSTETNGYHDSSSPHSTRKFKPPKTVSHTRPLSPSHEESDSGVAPKIKRHQGSKGGKQLDDEQYAKMLQAQENRGARATRGASKGIRKGTKAGVKKRSPNKKSEKKVKASDESELDEVGTDGEMREKEGKKKGGFHKEYHLSAPLADLIGEPTLSRPQVVKKIWAYIKARDLQDPNDKRQIICDERMQLVFKQDKVHMFTMNKILGNQLYDVED